MGSDNAHRRMVTASGSVLVGNEDQEMNYETMGWVCNSIAWAAMPLLVYILWRTLK